MTARIYYDTTYRFREIFDMETGVYIRSDVVSGRDKGTDPFMRSMPNLLDVGIMGSCAHGLSGLCRNAGTLCYQSGATKVQPHMSLASFKRIIDECKDWVFQVALGGRGDPNLHPDFEEILKYCRENGVVPNYTTSGFGLTPEQVRLTKEYCGAVAVSWYRTAYTFDALRAFLDSGVKTNVHFILDSTTLNEALFRLYTDDFPQGVNAVIFLIYKPVGSGDMSRMIKATDPRLQELVGVISLEHGFGIGFDACSAPLLVTSGGRLDLRTIDTCEGARFSMYITPDMKALPCSFDQDQRWAYDLSSGSIRDAWNSKQFEDFRSKLQEACPACENRGECLGGCPIIPDIVLCRRKNTQEGSI